MGKLRNFVSKLHHSTKRNYLERMVNNKTHCMKIAKKYGKDYWDGNRKYGYGGYRYIAGRWKLVAKKLIKTYKLNSNSKILDVGCGKAYLLYEIKLLIPDISIVGFDVSRYGLSCAKKSVRKNLFIHRAEKPYPFKDNQFDLVISLGCLHNLKISKLVVALKEIERVSKKSYIMLESYRNDRELFNLECWALTCELFFNNKEWIWVYNHFGYTGDYEFIYFT